MSNPSPKRLPLALFYRRPTAESDPRRTAQENIRRLLTQIETSRKISRFEHLQLMTAILSNQVETAQERRLINKIFEDAQTGQLKIVD
ncbi:MAG: hypothetical protein VKK04_26310 [Synechococcales bacterium]|nr:hypothetical protein [Synechococcales bacterium]